MSAFERRRLENIAANTAILKDISATAATIIPSKPLPKAPAPRKKTRSEPVKREHARPTRMSSRIAGIGADTEVLKRKLEVEAEHEAEKARAKRMRVNDDLNLGDIVVDGKKWGSGVAGLQGIVRGAQPGLRTFTEDDVKETTDEGLKALRKRLGGLDLYDKWVPNGESSRSVDAHAGLTALKISSWSRKGCTPWGFILPKTSPSSLRVIKRGRWGFLMPPRTARTLPRMTRTRTYQTLLFPHSRLIRGQYLHLSSPLSMRTPYTPPPMIPRSGK
jgi:hypothetical protein